MTRPARARIDLDALRHNYALARRLHGGRALAVLKANAYGHGAIPCARALADMADGFAVAFTDEALALRAAGIIRPILVLEGAFDADELRLANRHGLWMVVHHEHQVRMIEYQPDLRGLHAWLKADTGMRRAGFSTQAELADAHARLSASDKVADITLMTHLARADEPDQTATTRQIAAFKALTGGLPGDRSLSNSAGVLGWPAARGDWSRPGILLYGADPMPGAGHGLIPVMTLESRIFAVRGVQPGDAIGYGGRYVADRPMRVGLVAVGYADGYPRSAPSGTPVSVDGRPSRLVGRISMDMLTVDITDLAGAGVGSRVELWGRQVDVNVVARAAGTVAYELLCNVKRVPLDYSG
ncbi:alanine racemase [Pigmentiphaga sp. GD03639]|uniref:alanine racemase n=1 Tax=unclassified Pigmentiphaga TaxID=2626614 RepID=UPI0010451167|nr:MULTISPECIES: alanine racemase [unclassified Pigmentiphaga]MDH2237271.1 alanine racemase [Pigmentiphaga sp. GD03639]